MNLSELTSCEREVYGLIIQRLSDRDIATKLALSRTSVETINYKIYSKLGAKRHELIRRALEHHLVSEGFTKLK